MFLFHDLSLFLSLILNFYRGLKLKKKFNGHRAFGFSLLQFHPSCLCKSNLLTIVFNWVVSHTNTCVDFGDYCLDFSSWLSRPVKTDPTYIILFFPILQFKYFSPVGQSSFNLMYLAFKVLLVLFLSETIVYHKLMIYFHNLIV
jgi:hypothetical protein